MNNVTMTRLLALTCSGAESEEELASRVLEQVSTIGEEVLNSKTISVEQKRGVEGALKDTPIAFSVIYNYVINDPRYGDEDRKNLVFMLTKMVDDMVALGSMVNRDVAFSVLERSHRGGKKSVETRRKNAENGWRKAVRPMIVRLRADNPQWSQDDLASEVKALARKRSCRGTKLSRRWSGI